ncbi:MAG: lytic transglycosylase domain-containing protein [Opitutae bacterium]|nr:lytic transglycosylase domain-containing protein [Opitutae bacterium]
MFQAGIISLAALLLASGCGRNNAADPATPEAGWAAIRPLALQHRLAPTFVCALVAAESNFDPQARNGEARGLLQLKPEAWETVSREHYEPTVWAWRRNLGAGVAYLASCRSALPPRCRFSYPLVLAVYRHGLDQLASRDCNLAKLDPPDSPLARELWRGNLKPLPPPK